MPFKHILIAHSNNLHSIKAVLPQIIPWSHHLPLLNCCIYPNFQYSFSLFNDFIVGLYLLLISVIKAFICFSYKQFFSYNLSVSLEVTIKLGQKPFLTHYSSKMSLSLPALNILQVLLVFLSLCFCKLRKIS